MALAAGVRLGPYEIVAPLGAGGMGEVYRARDTRLDRIVAIKVLPAALAADPQLRERFEREARVISSLQHPHICALFDVGRDGDHEYLVLEYLEGETLADRLSRGALVPAEALRLAIEICDALDRAHRSGIVHRDLKPANVMLARGASVSAPPTAKLLDFGLARSAAPAVTTSSLSMLPTTPPTMTAQGTILGTLQYMAPEQIEGLEADARTDLFAFGAVLFEMLTGTTAFAGKTRATLLGAVLKDEPPRVSALQPLAPPAVDRIVATCLAKDPDDRYQSARDLLRDLKWAVIDHPARPHPAHARTSWVGDRRTVAIGGALSLAMLAAAFVAGRMLRPIAPPGDPIRFTIAPPPNTTLDTPSGGGTGLATQIAISPDARLLAFVAHNPNGYQLWVRPVGSLDARPLPGTDDATFPFWSPDNRYVAFFAGGKLKKVSLAGGPPVVLCDAVAGRGGAWNRDNVILFSPSTTDGLQRLSGAGGVPQTATTLDAAYGESSHRFPWFLPDGRHFLFTASVGTCCPPVKAGRVRVGSLDSTDSQTLAQADSSAVFSSGHVLFQREGTLMATPFDLASRQFTGDPYPVAERIAWEGSRYASISASSTGVLVHAGGGARPITQLSWIDRSGRSLGTVGEPAVYTAIALSPDERRVAVAIASDAAERRDIWLVEVATGTSTRFTFDAGVSNSPVWSRDSARLAFSANRSGRSGISAKRAEGTADEEILVASERGGTIALTPNDWSADGRSMIFTRGPGVSGSSDIWALPIAGDRKAFPIVQTAAFEGYASLAPGDRWIAYQATTEHGPTQIYVEPFPPTGRKFQVSSSGGIEPVWRPDGKELFFLSPEGRMMAAAVDISTQFQSATPVPLFRAPTVAPQGAVGRHYAVAKDGRFLVNVLQQQSSTAPITVVVNWLSAVQK
jgi:eukaryotic-like serine/threonine-protein kinase